MGLPKNRNYEDANIAAIVLAGVLAIIIILALFLFLCRRIWGHSKEGGKEGEVEVECEGEGGRVDAALAAEERGAHGYRDSIHVQRSALSDAESNLSQTQKIQPRKLLSIKSVLWRMQQDSSNFGNSQRITKFTFAQLQRATRNFTTILGNGNFGAVYKAKVGRRRYLSVKLLATNSKQGEKEFKTEVLQLGRLHHRNILSLVGYCAEGGQRLLAYEFMSNGTLETWLHDKNYGPLSWDQRVSISQGIARGIEYLHDGAVPPVIHRDIKARNILLDSSLNARLSDFGLSKGYDSVHRPTSSVRGSHGYVDPTYEETNILTDKSDVYSFGILLFELITGRNPEEGLTDYIQHILMGNVGLAPWLQILDPRLEGQCNSKELEEMVFIAFKCTERVPHKRPSMQMVAEALTKLGPKCDSATIFEKLSSWVFSYSDPDLRETVSLVDLYSPPQSDISDLYGPPPQH